jgi:hypothetical protein
MVDDNYSDNLLRLLTAQVSFLTGMVAAQQMFEKGYFALSASEKAAVDQSVLATVVANYQTLTPEFLVGPPDSLLEPAPPATSIQQGHILDIYGRLSERRHLRPWFPKHRQPS